MATPLRNARLLIVFSGSHPESLPIVKTLQVQLLGGFRLFYNEQPIPMVHQLRLQSLLAYLVIHRDLPQPRQQLAFLFWPDVSEARARANLRKALYELRKLLPNLDEIVQIEDHYLQWRTSTTTILDVEVFAATLARAAQPDRKEADRAALEQAVALYAGDLLPACYDDWLLLERERLRQRYFSALEQLITILEQHELASALTYAQRLLHCDSLNESTYRILMRLHVLNGDRATALHVYHNCVTLLQQELGVEPSAETQQLYQHLLNMPATPMVQSSATSTSGPDFSAVGAEKSGKIVKPALSLVGRRLEWKTLQIAWRKAVAGTAHFVLIAGEAGIGKTRLAEELLQWADRQGYCTAHSRSYAAEGRLAYAPITDWLNSQSIRSRLPELEPVWLGEVARLLPDLLVERADVPQPTPLTDSWQRQRFREALARAILLGRQPLLLVIDDLQWCDGETLEWLHYLLRLADHEPILVVGTVRPEEMADDHPLTTLAINLRYADQMTDIELGPLNSSETATLASQLARVALSHEQAAALYTQTEGHPLFIVETLRAGQNQQDDAKLAARATVSLPPKVQAVIQSRLVQLTAPARELAALAAIIGRAFTVEILAQVADSGEDTLLRGLDELWQRRLIREQGEHAYDFSHDKIREAAYASVSRLRRRHFHRRVAQALERAHATDLKPISGELAAHYEHAGLPEQAIASYEQAADVAQRIYAHAEASSYLIKALELLDHLPGTHEHLQQELRLRMAQANSLAALKGMAASEVKIAYTRAEELAVQMGDEKVRFDALEGLAISSMGRGNLHELREVLQQEFALAEQRGEAKTAKQLDLKRFHRWL